ncbi:MAG: hypothetical protein IIB81_04895 [Nanoarchaeota archaeon]|nr:hypothetical protein [Nanoarchaeota archaeon]
MKKNDMIMFTFNDKLYIIILNDDKATRVVLSLSWRSRFVTLRLGETISFDIDKDGKDDLLIALESKTLNKATLVLERINPDARKSREADSKDEKDSVSRSIEPTPEELQKEAAQTGIEGATITEKKSFWPIALFIVLIIALVPILIFAYNKAKPYLFKKETYPGEEERTGVGDQESSYKQLHSYVLKEMDKGFTPAQITDALEKAGWEKGMVDLVMGDIKKRPKL